jgi:hypothetical protein
MRKYSMIEVYSDLFKCSDFILEQVVACNEDVFSLAAKRVLLIRSLSRDLLDGCSLDDLCSF